MWVWHSCYFIVALFKKAPAWFRHETDAPYIMEHVGHRLLIMYNYYSFNDWQETGVDHSTELFLRMYEYCIVQITDPRPSPA